MANELKPCPFCGGKAHYTKEIASAGLAAVVTCSDNDCCTNHAETLQKAIDLWNTRPAAPVEGLETVKQELLGSVKFFDDFPPSIQNMANIRVVEAAHKYVEKAEAIIAAKERERNDSCKAWRDAFDSMHRRAMDAEADNAALTARVKELDLQLSVSKETAKIKRVEYLDLDQDHSELKADYAVSEAQLKAARKALEATHEAISEYYRYQYGGEMRGSYDGKPERDGLWKAMYQARAALEVIP